MTDYEFKSEFNEKVGFLSKKLLRLLSENSRISITEASKQLGVSRRTVENRIKKMEKELEIKYTIEVDEKTLGLSSPHIILIKFFGKPNYAQISNVLQTSHIPQVAVTVKGTYDIFVYANAESLSDYVYWEKTTQIMLSDYKASWQSSDLAFKHLGFFPLRDSLIKELNIPKMHRDILLLLNEDSRMSFSEMAKRLNMKPNTLAYNFNNLLKIGYIKRFTIVIRNFPEVSIIPLFGKYIISKGFEEDSMRMRKEVTFIDDKLPAISRCLFSAQLIGSYDFFFVGAYDNYSVGNEHLVTYYKMRYKRHKVNPMYGQVDKVLVGDFPIRSLDVRKEFKMIKWIPGTKPTVISESLSEREPNKAEHVSAAP